MRLGEKIRCLRFMEGMLRNMGREMTQSEVAAAVRNELNKKISQSYLSQIERGTRRHMTNTSRMLLARFFKVHPGYLVDDPEGYSTELTAHVPAPEERLDLWLVEGSDRFRRDSEVSRTLLRLARHRNTRGCLVLVGAILEAPGLADRLLHVLRPDQSEQQHSEPTVHEARVRTDSGGESRAAKQHRRSGGGGRFS
jgi:transcriptional regulator with XRE-family HTH domain